ncbi:MAG: succinate dehydrogenase/fumarate reductase iron-sulfur subunit [Desulfobacterales bacterium]|nr:MAG: succinate dehydrogenase/fumarate reductase iron-sulfur subunit [Desulfobacterales bacterium]
MNKQQSYNLTLKIRRFDPDSKRSWIQDYHVEAGRILRFVDLFRKINDEQDPNLAWSSSCEHGQCGSCSVKVNGKPLLACELLVENAVQYFKTITFQIEPLNVAPVVRDLVVDISTAYERIDQIKPYIIHPAPPPTENNEYPITPHELERYVNATRCINCFCCSSACISSHKTFLGPNAMLATIIRVMDPREQEKDQRLKILYSENGIYRCHSSRACSFVCPKEIDVAHFIAVAKEGRITEQE